MRLPSAPCAQLDLRQARAAARERLSDEDGRVRRACAELLVDWNEPDALWWLREELAREDRFFSVPAGRAARFDAWRVLSQRLKGEFDYQPARSVQENSAGLSAIDRALAEAGAGERPSLPPVARASGANEGDRVGLEVRSCRRGELFLRWSEGDVLYVGLGNAARLPLAEGSVERLVAALTTALEELGDEGLLGRSRLRFGALPLSTAREPPRPDPVDLQGPGSRRRPASAASRPHRASHAGDAPGRGSTRGGGLAGARPTPGGPSRARETCARGRGRTARALSYCRKCLWPRGLPSPSRSRGSSFAKKRGKVPPRRAYLFKRAGPEAPPVAVQQPSLRNLSLFVVGVLAVTAVLVSAYLDSRASATHTAGDGAYQLKADTDLDCLDDPAA